LLSSLNHLLLRRTNGDRPALQNTFHLKPSTMSFIKSLFSTSGIATALMVFYMCATFRNLYRLMHPLTSLDASQFDPRSLVRPLWKQGEPLYLQVYLSTHSSVSPSFFEAAYSDSTRRKRQQRNLEGAETNNAAEGSDSETEADADENYNTASADSTDTVLLWDERVNSPSFSRSFLLTVCNDNDSDAACRDGPSYRSASARLDEAEHVALQLLGEDGKGLFSVVSAAGHGIESTSILLTFYQSIYQKIKSLVGRDQEGTDAAQSKKASGILERRIVMLSSRSPLWSSLVRSNTTLSLHVLVLRANAVASSAWPPHTSDELRSAVVGASRRHALLGGKVELVKFDPPNHLRKPSRILHHDLVYLWKRLVSARHMKGVPPPWDMRHANPDHYRDYVEQKAMKLQGSGYPYWKPEVSIKYVTDHVDYPADYVGLSGMPLVQVPDRTAHPTGYSYTPAIHVDEIGLTSEKYIPVNASLTSLPLRISFDRSDVNADGEHGPTTLGSTGTSGGISPARWRLLSHLSQALESQKALGFDESDIDDVRRLIADTNVTLLMVTLLASALHMLFEFLTFKNEVNFWRNNQDLTGLSVRALFLDVAGQLVILLYLVEQDSSLLITVPSAIGCLIALWKCHRAAGFKFVRVSKDNSNSTIEPVSWWNALFRLTGYELRATRLEVKKSKGADRTSHEAERDRMSALTLESDRIATRTLGVFLLPLVLAYTLYQWMYVPHVGWYSWLITSSSSAVYALGFVLMTPQLFLNWKLKSVAHLPWRVLVYKSLNTFIDDLFSFIIRMPTMARISCFRDDVVFFIYLYQRWLYPVDASRPVEGGVGERALDDNANASNDGKDDKEVSHSKGGKRETKKDR
jgi:Cleft lip and palate transmembrane protein 1 (CLPTM1)